MPKEEKKVRDPGSNGSGPWPSDGERGPNADGAFRGNYRALLERVSDMVTVSDREGRIVYANPATERVSGYTPEEFVALDPFCRMHPDDRPRCEEAFGRLLNTPGLSLALEHRFRHKDGSWRWAEGTFEGLFDDPEIGGLVATVRDVTEEKQTEEALGKSEERQAFLLKLSDTLRPLSDPIGIQVEASRLLGEHLQVEHVAYAGIEGDEMVVRRDYTDGVPSMVGRYPKEAFGKTLADAFRESGTYVLTDAEADAELSEAEKENHRAVNMAAYAGVTLFKEGKLSAGFAAHSATPREWTKEEISLIEEVAERIWAAIERARVEEALRESEERLQLALDASAMGTFTYYPEEDRSEPDARMLGLFGLPEDGVLNLAVALETMIHPEDRVRYAEAVARSTDPAGSGELREEIRVIHPDGTEHWVSVMARVTFQGGRPTRMVGSAMDVTVRKQADEDRERLRASEAAMQAEDAERERISRELHDRVAHHMGVAHQSLELFSALRESTPERAADRLALARKTTKRALDQTRALSAELKRLQDEELKDGMEAAFGKIVGSYVPDGVEVELSFSGEESSIPRALATQVYLTMREAVRNAVKHSGCSRLAITLEIREGELRGLVEDDGEGFDPEAMEAATPSFGVGLWSMRERAEMLGGSLRVGSEPGTGTRVEVRAPLDGRRS
jgi:PAS domain S-box-containing protein